MEYLTDLFSIMQPSVYIIYLLMFINLVIFNYTLVHFFCKYFDKTIIKINYILLDYCMNYSLTLGVLGTLISVGISISEKSTSGGDLSQVIVDGFSSALLTTIIGGLVYGYCFLGQALMHQVVISDGNEV